MAFSGIDDGLGYQQLTIDATTSQAITAPTNVTVAYYLITPETQAARWRDDGTNPTSTIGHPLAVGATLKYDSKSIGKLKIIGQVASSIVNVTAYGKNP